MVLEKGDFRIVGMENGSETRLRDTGVGTGGNKGDIMVLSSAGNIKKATTATLTDPFWMTITSG
jgi:hypothetical protein